MPMSALTPVTAQHQRAEHREAEGERCLEAEHEQAVGGHQVAAFDDQRDHRRLGGREERGQRRHDGRDDVQRHQVGVEEHERQEQQAARDVGPDEDLAPVVAVDEHARDGAEHHRRHQEGEQQQRRRGGRLGQVVDLDGQAVQHHVAADLGQDLRQEEGQEPGVGQDPACLVGVRAWVVGRTHGGVARLPPSSRQGAALGWRTGPAGRAVLQSEGSGPAGGWHWTERLRLGGALRRDPGARRTPRSRCRSRR